MLSDESSSDSETGRFKCQSEKQNEYAKESSHDRLKSHKRRRPSENDRFSREFRNRNERDHLARHSNEKHRYSRYSPMGRRRHSRDRSVSNRSHDRHRYRGDSRERSKSKRYRSDSRDRKMIPRSRSHKSPSENRKHLKEEITKVPSKKNTDEKCNDYKRSLTPEKGKRSIILKPKPEEKVRKISSSPRPEEQTHREKSHEVQEGSYYSMIPAIVKEKSEESSEIDSSDDERLRAKLLNLEKELCKTKKKKHKKKQKRKSKEKISKIDDQDTASVEVSSTTDIKGNVEIDSVTTKVDLTEVSSTQKSNQKDSSEEGEISSEDDPQNNIEIDRNDLRHKLKRSVHNTGEIESPDLRERLKGKLDTCGPMLPPHLESRYRQSLSPEAKSPPFHPHGKAHRDIGPSIPQEMRKILESNHEINKIISSDEEVNIGPLPVGAEHKWSNAHVRLEERALDMKIKKLDGHSLQNTKIKSREQWMIELPEAKAKYLGLEARNFRAKEGPDMSDRSSWTDTPEEKSKKAAGLTKEENVETSMRREAQARQINNRDEEQEKEVKKHKKRHKREESLLDMHQKKLKKKKKKEDKDDDKKERRPFSRDLDLQVNRFDEAQKKSIIKKAQNLDSRFSRGAAKYL